MGSNSLGSFPLVLMKCASLGGTGWYLSWTQVPFSLVSFFFWSFSFTHFRKLSQLFGCLICSAAAAAKSLQSCPTLCDPIDSSPPGSSVPRILQARTLEWVAISFCRGSSQPRDRTQVSCIASRRFNLWATRERSFNWGGKGQCNSLKFNGKSNNTEHKLGIARKYMTSGKQAEWQNAMG